MRRKVGDRVQIKTKYFSEFDEMTGKIIYIDDYYYIFNVQLDEEWSVETPKEFRKEDLRKIKE